MASACTYALLLGPCFKTGRFQPLERINVEEKNSYIKYAIKSQLTLAHPVKQSFTGMKPGCYQEINDIS